MPGRRIWAAMMPPQAGGLPLVQIASAKCLSFDGRPYWFDGIYNESCSQKQFFAETVEDKVADFITQGNDLTILTYGQTSWGKTWTIDGSFYSDESTLPTLDDDENDQGILPRVLKKIFLNNHRPLKTRMAVAFYEIYCEKIIDLLTLRGNGAEQKEIKLFEDKSLDRVVLRSLTWLDLTGSTGENAYNTIKTALLAARTHRHFASTEMNARSSRSHAILDICIGGGGWLLIIPQKSICVSLIWPDQNVWQKPKAVGR